MQYQYALGLFYCHARRQRARDNRYSQQKARQLEAGKENQSVLPAAHRVSPAQYRLFSILTR